MSNEATGASQEDVGKPTIVNGYYGVGKVVRVIGRTVEVEFDYGIVATDQDEIYLLPAKLKEL